MKATMALEKVGADVKSDCPASAEAFKELTAAERRTGFARSVQVARAAVADEGQPDRVARPRAR
jgi:hypothetical protein